MQYEPLDRVLLKCLLFSVAGSAEAPESEAFGMAQEQFLSLYYNAEDSL